MSEVNNTSRSTPTSPPAVTVQSSGPNTSSGSKQAPVVEKIKITGKLPSQLPPLPSGLGFSCGLYFLTQFFIIISLTIISYWMTEYFGGLDLATKFDHLINYHPFFMVFAFVFLMANSILLLTSSEKLLFCRLLLWFLMLVISVIGLIITIWWHTREGFRHFQTLHSWLGMMTIVAIIFYLLFAYQVYFKSGQTVAQRIQLLYYLRLMSYGTLILAGTTSLIGTNQMMMIKVIEIYENIFGDTYVDKVKNISLMEKRVVIVHNETQQEEHYLRKNITANVIGLFLVFYVMSMIYMSTKMNYKPRGTLRREQVEQQIRQQIHNAMSNLEKQGAFKQNEQTDEDEDEDPLANIIRSPKSGHSSSATSN